MISWTDVRALSRSLIKWWWVIVAAVSLAAGSAFLISKYFEERYYSAKATLMVGNTFEAADPNEGDVSLATALTRFYGELAHREPILKPVAEQLKLPFSWSYIADRMMAPSVIDNANLLEIYIVDSNPERAALIANAIGNQLIAASPSSPEKIEAEQAVLAQQLADSDAKIKQLRQRIAELTDQRLLATSAGDATEINAKLTQFNTSLQEEEEVYRSLVSLKNGSTVNFLRFVEQAMPPSQPLPSKRLVATASAGIAGLLLALLAIVVLERIDTRWKGARDVQDRFQLRFLGEVPADVSLLNTTDAATPEREQAIRDVYTNVLLAGGRGGTQSLLVSSVHATEQRALVSLDLAIQFARAGHRVLLIGTDYASRAMHVILPEEARAALVPVDQESPLDVRAAIRRTIVPNLLLLPVGPGEVGGAALVATLHLPELASQMSYAADVIIFDGPAALDDAGAALLNPAVDGALLVLSADDNRSTIMKSRDRLLNDSSATILGAITLRTRKGTPAIAQPARQLAFPFNPSAVSHPSQEPAEQQL